MKFPHLWASLLTILSIFALFAGSAIFAQTQEQRYVHALAPEMLDLAVKGSALQRTAFQQPDLLPVFGSSEISMRVPRLSAQEFFRAYPSGFAPFTVAKLGITSLDIAQSIAAVGPAIKDKKVVISFTPTSFFVHRPNKKTYAAHFSRLHANALAFSPDLSASVKQLAAQQMLKVPDTLAGDPVLSLALRALAGDSLAGRAVYYLLWPLGRLQTWVLEIEDHWLTLNEIWSRPNPNPNVERREAPLHWPGLLMDAAQIANASASNNHYGIENEIWNRDYRGNLPGIGSKVDYYQERLETAQEWVDLELLLSILQELGAKPLLMSMPANGPILDAMGQTEALRSVYYYDRLERLAADYHVPLVDFREFDADITFSIDHDSHPSSKGWIYVNQALDQFFHGASR